MVETLLNELYELTDLSATRKEYSIPLETDFDFDDDPYIGVPDQEDGGYGDPRTPIDSRRFNGYVDYIDFGIDNMSYKTDDDDDDLEGAMVKQGPATEHKVSLREENGKVVWVLS
jgi:hypothetical protein